MADAEGQGPVPEKSPEKPAPVYKPVTIAKPAPPPEPPSAARSDLGVRAGSAVVMLVLAGIAVALGGWWWVVFVALVAVGVLVEWASLAFEFARSPFRRGLWLAGGLVYIGVAAAMLVSLRAERGGGNLLLPMVLVGVIATDVGAYFTGRTLGGPKIAPKISPSKTWSGLAGGMIAAAAAQIVLNQILSGGAWGWTWPRLALVGAMIAVIAQAGDFFESWMKRRAGVKDSGKLLPGHGGLFDRLDGLLAVMFVLGLLSLPIALYIQ